MTLASRLFILLFTAILAACSARPAPSLPPSASPRTSALPSQSPAPHASTSAEPSDAPPSATPALDSRTPVFLIVFENKGASQIVNNPDAPYLNALGAEYGYALNYYGVAYPSQPNYLALFSGSTHGVVDNEPRDITAPTLADQIDEAGLSWRVHVENVPPDCFTGPFSVDGPDGDGIYSRKHNPAISFTSISQDPQRCAYISDFSHLDPGAADFTMIVPNNCHSMHDCSIAEGDAWLEGFLPRIMESEAYRSGGVIFITFDEDTGGDGNNVSTIVVSEATRGGVVSDSAYSHYSLLRTVQELLGLPCLAESCDARPMSDLVEGPGSN